MLISHAVYKTTAGVYILGINITPTASGGRDVTTGATGATAVTPRFSDAFVALFQPGEENSAQHCKGGTKHFPMVTSLGVQVSKDNTTPVAFITYRISSYSFLP